MHADDPVHWQAWNADTLLLAKKLNKPILISSGYYSCHWCHVMQAENYQNSVTAQIINRHFIAVKIDRELDTELDNTMVDFSKRTTGQGGWPQHVILTPNGYPFAAFIYMQNAPLNDYLNRLANLWKKDANAIVKLAEQSNRPSQKATNTEPQKVLNVSLFRQKLFTAINQQKDELSGGLKGSSKFPRAPLLNTLLNLPELPEEIEEWVITTLDLMQSEHLYDHIHGGFYRYTVDPEWQIPHFEKMSYDSALLVNSYLLAGKRFARDNYLETAKHTLTYLRNHLYNEKIGLYQSSQSAIDNQGIEGGDYIFTQKQLRSRLNEAEFKAVEKAWQLNNPAPYEHGWHPKKFDHSLWPQIQHKLSASVDIIPKDTKGVISWNGLVLSSLSHAFAILNEPGYKKQAQQLAEKLTDILMKTAPPRALSHSGENLGQANLEDFAFVLQGLRDYQKMTGDNRFSLALSQLEAKAIQLFFINDRWQYDAQPLLPVQNKPPLTDGALPSPISTVLCLKPESMKPYQQEMQRLPIDYASLIKSLDCNSNQNSVK